MVSLNIANDLLREKDKILGVKSAQDNNVKALARKVEKALLRIKNRE